MAVAGLLYFSCISVELAAPPPRPSVTSIKTTVRVTHTPAASSTEEHGKTDRLTPGVACLLTWSCEAFSCSNSVLSYGQHGRTQLAEDCALDNARVVRVNCIQIKGPRWSTDTRNSDDGAARDCFITVCPHSIYKESSKIRFTWKVAVRGRR
jgi:hypothetical protein